MDKLREKIYLAALLHDIGKFYQRADGGAVNSSKALSPTTKNNISSICPTDGKGGYSHKHVLWTAQFLEDNKKDFAALEDTSENVNESLPMLAAGHHLNPVPTKLGKIIQTADHCSSGMDRTKLGLNQDENSTHNWDKFLEIPLISLFAHAGGVQIEELHQLPVSSLHTNKGFMPGNQKNVKEAYIQVWKDFQTAYSKISKANFDILDNSLYYLLHKHTCNIPSSTVDYPDISLFDHLKTTAAIALCLYDFYGEKKKSDEFLFIGADISGIQSFIYDIVSKCASKNLKGRSFYIHVLLKSIAHRLLYKLKLKEANIIYNSGGGFYVLAPNTTFVNNQLQLFKKELEDKIFEEFGVNFYLALASISLSSNTLMGTTDKNLGDIWQELATELNKQKRQRYSEQMKSAYNLFFEPQDSGGESHKDAITGEEFRRDELKIAFHSDTLAPVDLTKNKNIEAIRPNTAKYIQLGRWIKQAMFWIISTEELPIANHIEPLNLGIHNYFVSEEEAGKFTSKGKGFDNALILNLKFPGQQIDFSPAMKFGKNAVGFEFYGGNNFPVDNEGNAKTFDELCTGELKRLGILRMDVDNLGLIFKEGYPVKERTFSRMAGLSRNLDWFFKAYLNSIIQSNMDYREKCFVVYSGGDDLFIVGQWNIIIQLAEEINEEFKHWICSNPNLSLSAGLSIVPAKFPVMKGAELSGEAEEKAKAYSYPKTSLQPVRLKNAVSFLDYPLDWSVEYKLIKQLKNELVGFYTLNKQFPHSLLGKMTMLHDMAKIKYGVITNPKIYWLIAYDVGRLKHRLKNKEEKDWLEGMVKDIHQNTVKNQKVKTDYHAIELYNLAARWTELELRTNK